MATAGDVQPAVYTVPSGAAVESEIILAGGSFGRFGRTARRTPAAEAGVESSESSAPRPLRRLFGLMKSTGDAEETTEAETETADAPKESTLVLESGGPLVPPKPEAAAAKPTGKTPDRKSVEEKIAELYARDGREMPDFDYQPVPVDTPELKAARQKAGIKHPVLDATPEERAAAIAAEKAERQAAYQAKMAAARAEAARGFALEEPDPTDLVELDPEDLFPENPLPEIRPMNPAAAEQQKAVAAAPADSEDATKADAKQAEVSEDGWRKPKTTTEWYARIDEATADESTSNEEGLKPTADPVFTESVDMMEMSLESEAELVEATQDPLADVFADGDTAVEADESLNLSSEKPTPEWDAVVEQGAAEPIVAKQPETESIPLADTPKTAPAATTASTADADSANKPAATPTASPKEIVAARPEAGFKGFCPVTLCDHRELADADDRFSIVYHDTTYTFSSEGALEKFRGNPAKYAPVLGGKDVVRLHATGHEVEGVLDHAAWYAGRLYLFSSADTLAIFTASPKSYPIAE